MHFQFKNSFSHQIVRCAKGKVALLQKNAFLELFLRTIEEDKWNLFDKLGQLRTPTLQKINFPKGWFDIQIFHVFCCFLLLMMGTRICRNGWDNWSWNWQPSFGKWQSCVNTLKKILINYGANCIIFPTALTCCEQLRSTEGGFLYYIGSIQGLPHRLGL